MVDKPVRNPPRVKQKTNNKAERRVGIFWLYRNTLIVDSAPLSQAEAYGDALTYPTSHIDYWTAQQERGVLPNDVEYEDPPRGRVTYNKKKDEFLFLADLCIISSPEVVHQIIGVLNLPRHTEPFPDSHYRCKICLSRAHDRD